MLNYQRVHIDIYIYILHPIPKKKSGLHFGDAGLSMIRIDAFHGIPSGNLSQFTIENDPVEIVDFPSYNMVDIAIVFCKPLPGRVNFHFPMGFPMVFPLKTSILGWIINYKPGYGFQYQRHVFTGLGWAQRAPKVIQSVIKPIGFTIGKP